MGGGVVVVLTGQGEGENLPQFTQFIVLTDSGTLIISGTQNGDSLGVFAQLG